MDEIMISCLVRQFHDLILNDILLTYFYKGVAG